MKRLVSPHMVSQWDNQDESSNIEIPTACLHCFGARPGSTCEKYYSPTPLTQHASNEIM